MVTSKLNKLIFILVLYIFTTSCRDYQKECDCKTIIGLEHNVKLNSNELNNNFKGLKIQHIRNGRIIENISFENQHVVNAKRTIKMNRTKDLYRTDSIKFTFNNGKIIFIHGFITEPRFVGSNKKNFVGCKTIYYKMNELDSCYIGEYINL
mgnify:FL=1